MAGDHIEVYRHPVKPHFVIMVHPAIDGFILSCVEKAGVDLSAFGLPNQLKDFTKQTKDVMSNKDPRFKSLFRALADIGETSTFKRLVAYLCDNTYGTDNEEVVHIVSEDAEKEKRGNNSEGQ